MSLIEDKKYPLISIPFQKKRLRRIKSLGLRNLTVSEFTFLVHFTLHRDDKTIAFYRSKSVNNERNPEWLHLKFPEHVQCLRDFIIRIWITSSNSCRLFLEYDIHLDESMMPDDQKDDSQIYNNTLWIRMFGYIFTDSHMELPNPILDMELLNADKKLKKNQFMKSYSKQSILRMINLIEAVRAEQNLSIQYCAQLQKLTDQNEEYMSKIKEREFRYLRLENLKQYIQLQRSMSKKQSFLNKERLTNINERKRQLDENILLLLHQQNKLNSLINNLNQLKYQHYDLMQLNIYRQKCIISEIYQYIYPIINHGKNGFSICNIYLPNAEDKIYQTYLPREREKEIGAAAQYCSHFVFLISEFLQLPLRFPIEYNGTTPVKIHDYSLQSSSFSLYPNYDYKIFLYGIFLLNRNIAQIMSHCRLSHRNVDFRKTLENLKQLVEQYFTNMKNNKPIQLYGSIQQLTEPKNSNTYIDDVSKMSFIKKKSTLDLSTSSFIESSDFEENSIDNSDIDLFPLSNIISPRLTMQFVQQPKVLGKSIDFE